jgi:hypothetical protein
MGLVRGDEKLESGMGALELISWCFLKMMLIGLVS